MQLEDGQQQKKARHPLVTLGAPEELAVVRFYARSLAELALLAELPAVGLEGAQGVAQGDERPAEQHGRLGGAG